MIDNNEFYQRWQFTLQHQQHLNADEGRRQLFPLQFLHVPQQKWHRSELKVIWGEDQWYLSGGRSALWYCFGQVCQVRRKGGRDYPLLIGIGSTAVYLQSWVQWASLDDHPAKRSVRGLAKLITREGEGIHRGKEVKKWDKKYSKKLREGYHQFYREVQAKSKRDMQSPRRPFLRILRRDGGDQEEHQYHRRSAQIMAGLQIREMHADSQRSLP